MNTPPKQRLNKPILARLGFDALHIALNPREILKIGSDVIACLSLANAKLAGQTKTRNAVDNAKINGLGTPSCLAIHLIQRHTKNLGSGLRVNVHTIMKCLDHRGFTRDMRHQTQLNLRVVSRDQLVARCRNKGCSYLPTFGCTNGYVLYIRIRR